MWAPLYNVAKPNSSLILNVVHLRHSLGYSSTSSSLSVESPLIGGFAVSTGLKSIRSGVSSAVFVLASSVAWPVRTHKVSHQNHAFGNCHLHAV